MSNRLAEASSPYLRQHADNPVDWYSWDEEALREARDSGRPILLSIGYAACHWCHVMAHESFEDPATAALMNRLYVNIKVDREERPDLDKLYQTAQMLLTQRGGGWPLTLFLTPDKRVPFFGGTYFPPEPRHGLPAFSQILERVAEWYGEHAEELDKQNESVCAALQQIHQLPQATPWPEGLEADVIEGLARAFDARDGGFGGAPKFARPTQLQWLQQQDNPRAQHMATHTLSCMAEGGIQDHAGGGFYRYSVDAHWMIPHFEKMLYDQALLLPLYAEAWTRTESPPLRAAAAGIVSFVTRELQDESGGFYSSLDADSEGKEGKFYLWTPEEVQELIPEEHYPAFAFRFGLDRPANFEGRWHLHGFRTMLETAANTKQPVEELQGMFEQDLQRLFEARSARVRPGLGRQDADQLERPDDPRPDSGFAPVGRAGLVPQRGRRVRFRAAAVVGRPAVEGEFQPGEGAPECVSGRLRIHAGSGTFAAAGAAGVTRTWNLPNNLPESSPNSLRIPMEAFSLRRMTTRNCWFAPDFWQMMLPHPAARLPAKG